MNKSHINQTSNAPKAHHQVYSVVMKLRALFSGRLMLLSNHEQIVCKIQPHAGCWKKNISLETDKSFGCGWGAMECDYTSILCLCGVVWWSWENALNRFYVIRANRWTSTQLRCWQVCYGETIHFVIAIDLSKFYLFIIVFYLSFKVPGNKLY